MARAVDLIIGIGWIIFWIYWGVMAIKTRPAVQHRSANGIFIRLILVVLIVSVIHSLPKGWSQAHRNPYLLIVGLILYAMGLVLAVWARVYIGKSWGFPAAKQKGTELITTGPYRYIRHPIYTGILLGMVGTAVALTLYWLIVAVAFGIYFISSAMAEEKYLSRVFPGYPAYMEKTKMLLPFLF